MLHVSLSLQIVTCIIFTTFDIAGLTTSVNLACRTHNLQRMCTCTSTGSVLRWRTNQNGVFNGNGVEFSSSNPVGTSFTNMGFTVTLTTNTTGSLTSIMIIPTAAASCEITVTCEASTQTVNAKLIAVTSAGIKHCCATFS